MYLRVRLIFTQDKDLMINKIKWRSRPPFSSRSIKWRVFFIKSMLRKNHVGMDMRFFYLTVIFLYGDMFYLLKFDLLQIWRPKVQCTQSTHATFKMDKWAEDYIRICMFHLKPFFHMLDSILHMAILHQQFNEIHPELSQHRQSLSSFVKALNAWNFITFVDAAHDHFNKNYKLSGWHTRCGRGWKVGLTSTYLHGLLVKLVNLEINNLDYGIDYIMW